LQKYIFVVRFNQFQNRGSFTKDTGMTIQIDINKWIHEVEIILEKMQKLPDFPSGRTGGYLALTETMSDNLICLARAGKIVTGNDKAYEKYAPEKSRRLHGMHHGKGHVSSYQSKDETLNMYAGGIVTELIIVSFSGLSPDLWDEVLCLIFAIERGWISLSQATSIAEISTNNFFLRYIATFRFIRHS